MKKKIHLNKVSGASQPNKYQLLLLFKTNKYIWTSKSKKEAFRLLLRRNQQKLKPR